jgi:hypothetical protein
MRMMERSSASSGATMVQAMTTSRQKSQVSETHCVVSL